jgi:uncharacterized protein (DUF362 family)
MNLDTMLDARVAIADTRSAGYPQSSSDVGVATAVSAVARALGWSSDRGPLGHVIASGARVLVKPNLVLHANEGPWGLEPLVTHPSVIGAVVDAALQAGAAQVLVGDAPIQSCDMDALLERSGLGAWAARTARADARFRGVRDFRRTTCVLRGGVRIAAENLQPEDRFVLFDLGPESLLEPVTDDRGSFRVTWYDPRLMARTHRPGRHQYLVAREVLEADVVVNVPKLKTHQKAGVTCALKNLVGINGNKEYLPHHRVGGAEEGGDCYPRSSRLKRWLEYFADQRNQTTSQSVAAFWWGLTAVVSRIVRVGGDRYGVQGSWSGNDTIWRTCLDLNRILHYGRVDGSMADTPQRRVIHFVDAIVAGHGDGPLAPEDLPLDLIFAGGNAAAVDLVAAHLLAYDVSRLPLVREAFGKFPWPLTRFAPADVRVLGDGWENRALPELGARAVAAGISYPIGWRDAAAHLARAARQTAA